MAIRAVLRSRNSLRHPFSWTMMLRGLSCVTLGPKVDSVGVHAVRGSPFSGALMLVMVPLVGGVDRTHAW